MTSEHRKRQQNTYTQKQRQIRQEIANEYKRDGCFVCGEMDPVCLEFHHTDRSNKAIEVSRLINDKAPLNKIKEEIEKCVVLCSNCHAKLHAGRFTIPRM